MTNTLGGLIGLVGYDISGKYVDHESLDKLLLIAGSILLGLGVVFLVALEVRHGVRYHRPGQPG
jgi:hypothetical protein